MRGVSRLGASALVLQPMGCELASWCLLQEFFQCSSASRVFHQSHHMHLISCTGFVPTQDNSHTQHLVPSPLINDCSKLLIEARHRAHIETFHRAPGSTGSWSYASTGKCLGVSNHEGARSVLAYDWPSAAAAGRTSTLSPCRSGTGSAFAPEAEALCCTEKYGHIRSMGGSPFDCHDVR